MSRAPAAQVSFSSKVSRTFEVACTSMIAWAFAMVSIVSLGLIAFRLASGNIKEASVLTLLPASFVAGIETAQPWGLTFSGPTGAFIAGGEAMGVLLAVGLSMMFASTPRRLGLLMMLGWAGLWATDAVLILAQTWSHGWWQVSVQFLAATLALFIVVAAMAHRASRLWRVPVSI